MAHRRRLLTVASVLVVSLAVSCAPRPPATPTAAPTVPATPVPTATATPVPTATATSAPTATATLAPTATATSAPTATVTPSPLPSPTTPPLHVTLVGHIGGKGSPLAPAGEEFYDNPGQAWDVALVGTCAYVAQGGGHGAGPQYGNLAVIDVSDPAQPELVGSFTPKRMATDVVIVDGTAYLSDGRCSFGEAACYGALYTLDVTNPATPGLLGTYELEDMRAEKPWDRFWYASGIAVAGHYAYVTGGAYYSGSGSEYGLCVIDISQPAAPAKVGVLQSAEDGPLWAGRRVDVAGSYAYVAGMEDGLRVVDVSDPAAPREVGLADMPGQTRDVVVVGHYAYVAAAAGGLRVFDVSDPAHPSKVGSCSTPDTAEGVAVVGGYAYVAATGAGLRVIDISDPAHPVEVGYFDTPGYAVGVAVAGDCVYVADTMEGLFILRFQP